MALDASEFTDGAKPMPVFLLLDISGSMSWGDKIGTLNRAVETMIASFKKVAAEQVSIQMSVITFESRARLHIPLQPVENVTWSDLRADGGTNLADALTMAKNMIEDRSVVPSRAYRPVVILVSDGYPFDGWERPMNSFINSGRSQKCDRMSMLIGDNSAASVMEQFLRGSGNRVFFAKDAGDIPTFFHFATMTTVSRANSGAPNTTIAMPAFASENTLAATVADTQVTSVGNFQSTIVLNDEEQDDE